MPQGTPTNNTADGPSGFPPPDPRRRRELHRRATRPARDAGERWRAFPGPSALGLSQRLAGEIRHLTGADLTGGGKGHEPSPLACHLGVLPGADARPRVGPSGDQLRFRSYFATYVRGRGPLPAFRVRTTPYGLLPVSSLLRWRPQPARRAPRRGCPMYWLLCVKPGLGRWRILLGSAALRTLTATCLMPEYGCQRSESPSAERVGRGSHREPVAILWHRLLWRDRHMAPVVGEPGRDHTPGSAAFGPGR